MAEQLRQLVRSIGARIIWLAIAPVGAFVPAAVGQPVELELVLAVDASGSVDNWEFNLQRRGLAAAFRDPGVIAAIQGAGTVAVALVQWAGPDEQAVAVSWVTVFDAASAAALADRIEGSQRRYYGTTSITALLLGAVAMLQANRIEGRRQVIDVSGDGPNNSGQDPDWVRDWAVSTGITINGLAILNETADLGRYYREHVIGGLGSFLIDASNYQGFAEAIRRKLIREIRGAPIASARPDRWQRPNCAPVASGRRREGRSRIDVRPCEGRLFGPLLGNDHTNFGG